MNHGFGCFYLVSSKPENLSWTVILHKFNKLELTCMNCSWVAELEQKQIFLPFYIPFKFFCLGLPAIHVYEIIFYLPTVLPCSRCDSHVSIPNLELAATGSPGKLLHSTVQESQCHSISVPVWTAARYACLDIPIMVIIILCWCFTTIILNSFSYISTSPFENVWRITSPKWIWDFNMFVSYFWSNYDDPRTEAKWNKIT